VGASKGEVERGKGRKGGLSMCSRNPSTTTLEGKHIVGGGASIKSGGRERKVGGGKEFGMAEAGHLE